LLGNADLAVAVLADKRLAGAKLARVWHASNVSLRVARPDSVQGLARQDIEVPGLGIHGRGRAHGQAKDFLNQGPWHGVGLIAANATATEDYVIKLHVTPQIGLHR
jgi:hypothetical protein